MSNFLFFTNFYKFSFIFCVKNFELSCFKHHNKVTIAGKRSNKNLVKFLNFFSKN